MEPPTLRDEFATTVKYQARSANQDEKVLFKLILEKALEEDRDFQRRKRSRPKDQDDQNKKGMRTSDECDHPRYKFRKVDNGAMPMRKRTGIIPKQDGHLKYARKESSGPPAGGCLKFKGNQWLIQCPTATSDEKKDLLRRMHQRRDEKRGPRTVSREA